jgi:hypothetical protein
MRSKRRDPIPNVAADPVQATKAKARGYRASHSLQAMVYLFAGKLELLPFT